MMEEKIESQPFDVGLENLELIRYGDRLFFGKHVRGIDAQTYYRRG